MVLETVHTITELRARVAEWRRRGERIAFVPTMGNLHQGHLQLVERAAERAERVVVSIYVNPIQFNEANDFSAYPRTLEQDREQLAAGSATLLFAPADSEVYPYGHDNLALVEVPDLSDILCGASRAGHFVGVATVVSKLFNMVQPDLALFGEKDFQQLLVIRRMVRDLDFPVEVIGVPTVREADGLAMSSRNGYLSESERATAPALYRALQRAAEQLRSGESDHAAIGAEGVAALAAAGLEPDYFVVRRQYDLAPAEAGDGELVVLTAARLGRARLIDNLPLTLMDRA